MIMIKKLAPLFLIPDDNFMTG